MEREREARRVVDGRVNQGYKVVKAQGREDRTLWEESGPR
jgi:hypothetical protein